MPPQTKKSDPARRVPCRCRAFDCYLGSFQDSHGVPQIGVEVLPKTRAAHELADLRNQAQENAHSPTALLSQQSTSARSTNQDRLISPLARLSLASPESPTGPSSRLDRRNPYQSLKSTPCPVSHPNLGIYEPRLSPSNRSEHKASSSEDESLPSSSTPSIPNNEPSVLAKICLAATTARESGVVPYNCGALILGPQHPSSVDVTNQHYLYFYRSVLST